MITTSFGPQNFIVIKALKSIYISSGLRKLSTRNQLCAGTRQSDSKINSSSI